MYAFVNDNSLKEHATEKIGNIRINVTAWNIDSIEFDVLFAHELEINSGAAGVVDTDNSGHEEFGNILFGSTVEIEALFSQAGSARTLGT